MPLGKTSKAAIVAITLSLGGVAGIAAAMQDAKPMVVDAGSLSIDSTNGLRVYEGKPFTGTSQKLRPDGRVVEADSFVDGLRDGPSRIWFDDGTLAYETQFAGGVREGLSQTWWSNGNERSRTMFVADRQEGEAWVWYATGEKYKRHFYAAGVPSGIQQAWRKNGKLYENFEIRGGRSYGLRNSKICSEVKESEEAGGASVVTRIG